MPFSDDERELEEWRRAHDEFCLEAGYCFTGGSTDASTRARIAGLQAVVPYLPPNPNVAIPMLLTCPFCGARHIDEGEFATKLHHTHACQTCGMVWRPALVPTTGVRFLPGFKNAALAGEAATAAETTQIGSVHEHATAQPERPNPTPILPKKERTK